MSGVAAGGPRVLLVEDEALIAEELRERLSRLGMTVVDSVDSADLAVERALRTEPDVVVMDIHLRGEPDGVEAARRIRQRVDIPLIYLTAHSDRSTIERAKETVPLAFVFKPFHERELVVAIELAIRRHLVERARLKRAEGEIGRLREQLAHAERVMILRDAQDREAKRVSAQARALLDTLTPREREVFWLVVRGLLNRQIAAELGTSERTIKAHRSRVMRKMKVDSVADLVRLAERLGS